MFKKFSIILLSVCLCGAVYAKTAKPAGESKLCSTYECVDNQMLELKKNAIANTDMKKGSVITYTDQVSMSSGNFLADGLFGANSVYKMIFTARIDDVSLDDDRIVITILDGRMSKIKDSTSQPGNFVKYLNEQRGTTKNYSLAAMLNVKLMDKLKAGEISDKDVNNIIMLYFGNAGRDEMDTIANAMAKLGFPRFSVAVYGLIRSDMKNKGDDTSGINAKIDDVMAKNGLTGMDLHSADWIKAMSKEVVAINKILITKKN